MEKQEALMEIIEHASSSVFIHLRNEEMDAAVDRFTRLIGEPIKVSLLNPRDHFSVSVSFEDGNTNYCLFSGNYYSEEEAEEIYNKYFTRAEKVRKDNAV